MPKHLANNGKRGVGIVKTLLALDELLDPSLCARGVWHIRDPRPRPAANAESAIADTNEKFVQKCPKFGSLFFRRLYPYGPYPNFIYLLFTCVCCACFRSNYVDIFDTRIRVYGRSTSSLTLYCCSRLSSQLNAVVGCWPSCFSCPSSGLLFARRYARLPRLRAQLSNTKCTSRPSKQLWALRWAEPKSVSVGRTAGGTKACSERRFLYAG